MERRDLAVAGILLWIWGATPPPPRFLREWTQRNPTAMQWGSLGLIIYTFGTEYQFVPAVKITALIAFLYHLSERMLEHYYYHDMYKVGEAAVENRFSLL